MASILDKFDFDDEPQAQSLEPSKVLDSSGVTQPPKSMLDRFDFQSEEVEVQEPTKPVSILDRFDFDQPDPIAAPSPQIQSIQESQGLDAEDPDKPSPLFQPIFEEQKVEDTGPGVTRQTRDRIFELRQRSQEAIESGDVDGGKRFATQADLFEQNLSQLELGQESFEESKAAFEILRKIYIPVREAFGGLTLGTGDNAFEAIERGIGGEIKPEGGLETVNAVVWDLIGSMASGRALFGQFGKGLKRAQTGLQAIKQTLMLRGSVGLAQSSARNLADFSSGNISGADAAANVVQSTVGSMIPIVPEAFVKAGLLNFVSQVGTDFTFDVLTDAFWRKRLTKENWREWLAWEIPNLAVAVVAGARDNFGTDRKSFEATQELIKEGFSQIPQAIKDRARRVEESGLGKEVEDNIHKPIREIGKSLAEQGQRAEGEEPLLDLGGTPPPRPEVSDSVKNPPLPDQPPQDNISQSLKAVAPDNAKQERRLTMDTAEEVFSKVKPGSTLNTISNKIQGDLDSRRGLKFDGQPEDVSDVPFKNFAGENVGGEPSVRPVQASNKLAQEAQDIFDRQDIDLSKANKKSIKERVNSFLKIAVDPKIPIQEKLMKTNIGREAAIRQDLASGAPAEALRQFEQVRNEVYSDLPRPLRKMFGNYLQAVRTLEVSDLSKAGKLQQSDVEIKSPTTRDQSSAFIEHLRQDQPENLRLMEQAGVKYFSAMRDQLKQSLDAGIIDRATFDRLTDLHKHYSPRLFIQHLDNERSGSSETGKKISLTNSGIKALDKGSEAAMVKNPEALLQEVIGRTQSVIFKNRATASLAKVAELDPNNEMGVKILKKGERVGRDEETIQFFKDGKEVELVMPKEMAESWITGPPRVNETWAKWAPLISGSALVKPLATGFNPEFAISNLPRDMALSWLSTKEYSNIGPVAMVQQISDMRKVFKDAATKSGRTTDYIKEGGGMDFLTTQGTRVSGEFGKSVGGGIRNVGKILSYAGETSELLMRLALRERAMKNGASQEEATWIARNYLDFAKGGTGAKYADKVVPYLNAGIQGTRGALRAFKKGDRATGLIKVAQIMSFGALIEMFNTMMNPEAMDSISDKEKETKWIITTGQKHKDEDGNDRHSYIAIPKDQGQRVFAAIGQELMGKSMGKDVDGSTIISAAQDFIPVGTQSLLPPSVSALIGYVSNKDFWRNEDVWKGREVDPSQEFFNSTPEPFVAWGKMTGLSPERSRMALSKIIPQNPLTYMMGSAWKAISPDDDDLNKEMDMSIQKIPGIRRIYRSTFPQNISDNLAKDARILGVATTNDNGSPRSKIQIQKDVDRAEVSRNNKRQENDRQLDRIANKGDLSEVQRFLESMSETDPNEAKRLLGRTKSRHKDLLSGE